MFLDNKELMINTDCMVCNIIDFIRSRTEHYDCELQINIIMIISNALVLKSAIKFL